jgi:hypothetical protein
VAVRRATAGAQGNGKARRARIAQLLAPEVPISFSPSEPNLSMEMGDSAMGKHGKLPIPSQIPVLRGTRAETDEQLLQSWLDSLNSDANIEDLVGPDCSWYCKS